MDSGSCCVRDTRSRLTPIRFGGARAFRHRRGYCNGPSGIADRGACGETAHARGSPPRWGIHNSHRLTPHSARWSGSIRRTAWFAQPDQTEPPYFLTLADVSPRASATADAMTWRRIGNEWHGDQIMTTSNGPARAHVEVDIRTWGTRLVRASLIVILDIIVAGLLWALGAMAEGGFVRWVRWRASRWALSYRGRLTLALFTFFVVPAVAFGAWSYQRLRGDDRDVRELLVRETLTAATEDDSNAIRPVRSSVPRRYFCSRERC